MKIQHYKKSRNLEDAEQCEKKSCEQQNISSVKKKYLIVEKSGNEQHDEHFRDTYFIKCNENINRIEIRQYVGFPLGHEQQFVW
ncbi:unnamed protein product [Rotaria sp. Silwood2]|nr:unnamed protein product [Rotaria sp. Silwood2]CAF3946151.1 unnamed protein product [Rotaria sp. Silwood2]